MKQRLNTDYEEFRSEPTRQIGSLFFAPLRLCVSHLSPTGDVYELFAKRTHRSAQFTVPGLKFKFLKLRNEPNPYGSQISDLRFEMGGASRICHQTNGNRYLKFVPS
jgi:hypothetical protein